MLTKLLKVRFTTHPCDGTPDQARESYVPGGRINMGRLNNPYPVEEFELLLDATQSLIFQEVKRASSPGGNYDVSYYAEVKEHLRTELQDDQLTIFYPKIARAWHSYGDSGTRELRALGPTEISIPVPGNSGQTKTVNVIYSSVQV